MPPSPSTHRLPGALLALLIALLPGCAVSGQPEPGRAASALAPLPTLAAPAPTPGITPIVSGSLPQPPVAPPPRLAAPQQAAPPTAEPPTAEPPTAEPPTAEPPTAEPPTVVPPTALPAPAVGPLDPPVRAAVNGVAYEAIIVMPPEVVAHAREIYAAGRALGRNPGAYSKVGDSTIQAPHFMARFDETGYNLGDYAFLQPVIDQFKGSHAREGAAVRLGLHSWSAVDPVWADPSLCAGGETPVACEIRLHNPSILLIRLGTNDAGVAELFETSIRQIVDTAVAAGVIPVIGTKADRHEGSNENNDILRRIAAEYRIPLWDFDQVANTLPGRGLDVDFAHMNTFYAHDYTDPTAFTRGHAMHNLTALMALDAVWREVMAER
jgi:hypothetical protein